MQPNQSPRLFPPLVAAVVAALQAIFQEGRYADKVIEQTLKADRRQGARDRAFIAEQVYDIVRWYRLLWEVWGREPVTPAEWWELFGVHWVLQGHTLPAWREFAGLDLATIPARQQAALGHRAVAASIPDWLDARAATELGELWPATLQALNQPAQLVLRVNTLAATKAQVQASLAAADIHTQALDGDALLLTERHHLFQTQAFQQGWIEVQDYSSQQVAPFLEVTPGMRVVDACAGAGGKTLHLAALLANKGQILALDTEGWKLEELRKRARRAGAHLVETRTIDSSKVIKRLHLSADRVLLDAPCSGLGVLRRNPDAKWKLSDAFIERIRTVQQDIISRYSAMLKPGGKLVYATCSILPSENEQQVAAFLASDAGRGFSLETQRTILPQDEGFDGFFMARLVRKSTS